MLGPLVCPIGACCDMHGKIENGVAFIIGLFGMSLADAIAAWIKSGDFINAVRGKVGL